VVPPKIELTLPDESDPDAAAPAKGATAEAPPTLPERPTIPVPEQMPIALPVREASVRRGITVIPPGTIGVPTGIEAGLARVGGTARLIDLDGVPRATVQGAPVYPGEARRTGMSGEVLVEFLVDESGVVHDPRVIRASAAVFEEAALRAVARWRFEPGRRHGTVVRFRMSVPIVFSLADS
jgi:protein TonB